MLPRYVSFVTAWPRAVIAVTLAVTLVLAGFIPRLQVLLDVDDQIPPGHPLVVVGQRIEQQFGGKFTTIIGVYPEQGTVYQPDVLAKVDRITRGLEALPGVRAGSVLSLTSKQLEDVRSTDDAIEITPLLPKLPSTPAEAVQLEERVRHNHPITSLLVNDTGSATAILCDFSDFERAGGAARVYERIEAILAPERGSGIEIAMAGAPSILYWLMAYTQRVGGLFVLALLMIGYLHYRAFRTLQGMFVPLVTALLGVVWALGLMGVIGAALDPWNVMTPILLLAIGAGHSVQILKRYYEEYTRARAAAPLEAAQEHNRTAVLRATTQVGQVMIAAGTIAALSFGSLAAFGLPSIKNFGLCTAFGIVAALVVELSLIPALRMLLAPPNASQRDREQQREVFDPWLDALSERVRRGGEKPFLWAFLGLLLVASVGALRLEAGNSMSAQFFERNAPVRGFRLADEKLAGTRVVQVLVEGKQTEAIQDPRVLSAMASLTEFIERQPVPVGKVVSFAQVLQQMKRVIDGSAAQAALPSSKEEVAQYLLLYSLSGNEQNLRRMVDADYRNTVLTVYLRTDDYGAIQRLTTAIDGESARLFAGLPVEVRAGGGMTNAIALNETMVRGKVLNLLQISVLVLVVSAGLFRSLVGGLLVLVPLATSALVNLGLMGWLGIPLSMGTAAISAMAVGVGADYAVYFLSRVREEAERQPDLREATAAALHTSGKAIAYVATAVTGGYLCLCLSLFKVHVLLGSLVALTMVTSSLATLLFLPAVLLRIAPRFATPVAGGSRTTHAPAIASIP